MMKTFYKLAWIFVALVAAVSFLMGYFDVIAMIVLSLVAVSLVYALSLWSVFTNTPDMTPAYCKETTNLTKGRNL